MWFLDPPEYWDPPGGGRYLAYANDVRGVVAAVERERFGGAMPVLYKHMVAVSYQLAIFRCVCVLLFFFGGGGAGTAVRSQCCGKGDRAVRCGGWDGDRAWWQRERALTARHSRRRPCAPTNRLWRGLPGRGPGEYANPGLCPPPTPPPPHPTCLPAAMRWQLQ